MSRPAHGQFVFPRTGRTSAAGFVRYVWESELQSWGKRFLTFHRNMLFLPPVAREHVRDSLGTCHTSPNRRREKAKKKRPPSRASRKWSGGQEETARVQLGLDSQEEGAFLSNGTISANRLVTSGASQNPGQSSADIRCQSFSALVCPKALHCTLLAWNVASLLLPVRPQILITMLVCCFGAGDAALILGPHYLRMAA